MSHQEADIEGIRNAISYLSEKLAGIELEIRDEDNMELDRLYGKAKRVKKSVKKPADRK